MQKVTIFNCSSSRLPTYLLFAMNQTTTMMMMMTRRTLMMATAMMVSFSGFSVSEYKVQTVDYNNTAQSKRAH